MKTIGLSRIAGDNGGVNRAMPKLIAINTITAGSAKSLYIRCYDNLSFIFFSAHLYDKDLLFGSFQCLIVMKRFLRLQVQIFCIFLYSIVAGIFHPFIIENYNESYHFHHLSSTCSSTKYSLKTVHFVTKPIVPPTHQALKPENSWSAQLRSSEIVFDETLRKVFNPDPRGKSSHLPKSATSPQEVVSKQSSKGRTQLFLEGLLWRKHSY